MILYSILQIVIGKNIIMNTTEKIRAEIDRRIKSLNKQAEAYIDVDCETMIEETRVKKEELRSLLAFLDTLENATKANEVLMGRVKAPSLDMESVRRRLDTLQEQDRPEPYNPTYDEAYLNEKIKKATKSWKGVDVNKMLAECRGYDEPEVDLDANIEME